MKITEERIYELFSNPSEHKPTNAEVDTMVNEIRNSRTSLEWFKYKVDQLPEEVPGIHSWKSVVLKTLVGDDQEHANRVRRVIQLISDSPVSTGSGNEHRMLLTNEGLSFLFQEIDTLKQAGYIE